MGKAQRRKVERAAQPSPPAAAGPRPGHLHALAAVVGAPALIAATVLLLYANSFAIPFLFDDVFEITQNPAVKTVEPLLSYAQRSRGIPALTFALNHRWGALNVWGYHLVNVLVHIANSLLVYALVHFTLRLPALRARYGASGRWLALLVALIFAAHPLQTMAAAYVVQRTESIAAFWYLLTVLLAAMGSVAQRRGTQLACYAGAALAAALGVLSKEIVATVVLAVVVYRWCFVGGDRAPRRRWVTAALAVLLLLPAAYAVALAWPYLFGAPEDPFAAPRRAWLYIPTAGFSVEGVTAWQYLFTQFGVILWYLRLFVLPTAQTFDYGWPLVDAFWRADVVLPLAVLLAAAGAAIASRRRYPLVTFCIAWVFITLAPTSSIVPLRDAAFEHRMYLPIVGLAWLAIVGAFDLLEPLAHWLRRPLGSVRRAAAGFALAWIAVLGLATIARNAVLADPLALAADSVAKAPHHWRAHYALGDELMRRQRDDEAIAAFEESIRLDGNQGAPRVQLGGLYIARRRYEDAERVLTPATDLLEESVVAAAHLQLAAVYQARGDQDGAALALQHVVTLKPQWVTAHVQLAALFARRGAWFAAAGEFDKAVTLSPNRPALREDAARASYAAARDFHEAGRPNAAISMLEKAAAFRPEWAAPEHFRAYVLAERDEWDAAALALQRAAAREPGNALIAENLRRAHAHEPLIAPPDEGPARLHPARDIDTADRPE